MKTGKAYISSLGTTGLLIASSVLLLLVCGTLVAFDRWPDDEPSRADVVAVDGSDRATRAREVIAERRRAAGARAVERRRRAAAQRRRAAGRAPAARGGKESKAAPVADPVISNLPAPDSDGSPGPPSGGSAAPTAGAPGAGGGSGGGGGQGGETTRQIGDAVSNVSPEAGGAIGDVGGSLDGAIGGSPPSLAP